MGKTDRECIASCLAGQKEDFSQLLSQYSRPLLGYITGKYGSNSLSEDIAQETFVRAYFKLSTLRKPESFFSWLIGIASKVANELIRVETRHKETIAQAAKITNENENTDHSDILEKAIAKLPPAQLEVIMLRYYSNYSCRQIAQSLEMPVGSVTKKLSRAYESLRKQMNREVQ